MGDLTLSPGTLYLFLLTASNQSVVPTDAANLVGANNADTYAGGSFWISSNGANTAALFTAGAFSAVDGVSDASFSATFLASQQVVPEPSVLWLSGFGVTVLLLFMRLRPRSGSQK